MAGELVDRPPGTGQIHKISTFGFDFLAILLFVFALSVFFSETRDLDLSNGVGPISVYALLKKLSGFQGRGG